MAPKYYTLRARLVRLTSAALLTLLLAAWALWTTLLISEAPSIAAQMPWFLRMMLLQQATEQRQNPKKRLAAHTELARVRASLESEHARSSWASFPTVDDSWIDTTGGSSFTKSNISSNSSAGARTSMSSSSDASRVGRPINSQNDGVSSITVLGHLCAAASQGKHAHVHDVLKSFEVQSRVAAGARAASHMRIVFAGLVHRRKSGKDHSLALEMDQFAQLGQFFKDWRVVLYESNSHPNTVRQVNRLCNLPAFNRSSSSSSIDISGGNYHDVRDSKHMTEDTLMPRINAAAPNRVFCLTGQAGSSKGSHGDQSELRLTGMATMRNLYLNYIREHPFLKHFDVLAVADLDLHYITAHYLPHRMQGNKHNYSGVSLAPGWNALAALSAFGLNDNKIGMNNIGGNSSSSVISSSSIGSVSSSSSSRRQASIVKEKQELPWPFLCANGVVEFNARHFDSFAFEPEALGQKRDWVFGAHKDHRGIPVTSCFGGLTFYDLPLLVASKCRYRAAAEVCEHSLLHHCLLKHHSKILSKEAKATSKSSSPEQDMVRRRLAREEGRQEIRAVSREDDGSDARRKRRLAADPNTLKAPRRGGLLYPLLTNQMDNEAARICVSVEL